MRRVAVLITLAATAASAQELGHKLLGGLGIDAGVQPNAGIYLANRLAWYGANRVRDRNGDLVPIRGLDLDLVGDGIGAVASFKFAHTPYFGFAFAIPIAHVSLSSDNPFASVDRFGLSDLFVAPIQLGWRLPHVDVVGSYSFYAPTGWFQPRGGSVGRGHWTHELSFGGALFFDEHRRVRVSFLGSYDLNGKKRGIDITRGDTFSIQGGAGATLFRVLDVGLAAYFLWQVHDDRGSDLPILLRGARDRVMGVGPELGVMLPRLRTRLVARYEWEMAVESRPQGQVLSVGLTVAAWRQR